MIMGVPPIAFPVTAQVYSGESLSSSDGASSQHSKERESS